MADGAEKNMTLHIPPLLITHSSRPPQLDIMEPKVPDDIYKTHLENNSESHTCFVRRDL